MSRATSNIDQIADQWVGKMAELSPSFATYIGRPGNEDKIDEPSPEAEAEFIAETKKVLAQLAEATPQDKVDEVSLDAM